MSIPESVHGRVCFDQTYSRPRNGNTLVSSMQISGMKLKVLKEHLKSEFQTEPNKNPNSISDSSRPEETDSDTSLARGTHSVVSISDDEISSNSFSKENSEENLKALAELPEKNLPVLSSSIGKGSSGNSNSSSASSSVQSKPPSGTSEKRRVVGSQTSGIDVNLSAASSKELKKIEKQILQQKHAMEKKIKSEKREQEKKSRAQQKEDRKKEKTPPPTAANPEKRTSFVKSFSTLLSSPTKQKGEFRVVSSDASSQETIDLSSSSFRNPRDPFSSLPELVLVTIFKPWSNVDLLSPCLVCKHWKTLLERLPIWKLSDPNVFNIENTPKIPFSKEVDTLPQILNLEYRNQQLLFASIPESACFETEKVLSLLRMIAILTKMGNHESLKSKLQTLEQTHVAFKNPIEAGLAVLLQSEKYFFTKKKQKDHKDTKKKNFMVKESSSEIKERMYYKAIDYFNEGKYWELGIALLREMRAVKQFETRSYEEGLENERDLLLKVRSQDRFFETYYYTEFVGSGFPPYYQKKKFIFRGAELERLGAFVNKMKERFPKIEILTRPPTNEQSESDNQYLHVITCTPASFEEAQGKKREFREDMPSQMRRFYRNTGVNIFSYSVPFVPEGLAKENETNIWIRKTFFWCKDTFPTINRCSPVMRITIAEIGPLEHATNNVLEKNDQLSEMIDRVAISKTFHTQLPMTLSGIVDAAVHGGTQKYLDAFYTTDFIKNSSPTQRELLITLRKALFTQSEIVEKGLVVNGRHAPENMKKMQEHLLKTHEAMKKTLEAIPEIAEAPEGSSKRGPSLLQLKRSLQSLEILDSPKTVATEIHEEEGALVDPSAASPPLDATKPSDQSHEPVKEEEK